MATRVIAYVDGFNLFHAIDALVGHPDKKLRVPHNKVNLWSLIEDRKKDDEVLVAVHYFSAYAYWKSDKIVSSHKRYVRALEKAGVTVTMGQFKEKHAHCNQCGNTWKAHEEKETDVNLSLKILSDGFEDKYDRAYIVSADTDIAPAVREVRARFPKKGFFVLAPPRRHKFARDLVQSAHASSAIKPLHIKRNLFDWK